MNRLEQARFEGWTKIIIGNKDGANVYNDMAGTAKEFESLEKARGAEGFGAKIINTDR